MSRCSFALASALLFCRMVCSLSMRLKHSNTTPLAETPKNQATRTTPFVTVVDEGCQNAQAFSGWGGGCYEVPDEGFFASCMVDKSPVVKMIMKRPHFVKGRRCAELGFKPLQLPECFPDGHCTTAPDYCYGGDKTKVSFFTSTQDWFLTRVIGNGFNPQVDCPAWQQAYPQCYQSEPSFLTLAEEQYEPSFVTVVDEGCQNAQAFSGWRGICHGGCYEVPDEGFFASCMVDKSPVVKMIMKRPHFVKGRRCAKLGFKPLQLPECFPDGHCTTAPDYCYGGEKTKVRFFTSTQNWFLTRVIGNGFNPQVDCPAWQQAYPQCYA